MTNRSAPETHLRGAVRWNGSREGDNSDWKHRQKGSEDFRFLTTGKEGTSRGSHRRHTVQGRDQQEIRGKSGRGSKLGGKSRAVQRNTML